MTFLTAFGVSIFAFVGVFIFSVIMHFVTHWVLDTFDETYGGMIMGAICILLLTVILWGFTNLG